jgi:DNA-binding cell septation regulator SpoVG
MASATSLALWDLPTPPASRIEVLTLVAAGPGNLKALASVRIGPSLVVHKCRVIQQPGQRAWVSMPQECWDGEDGRAHYTALVELSGTLRTRVEAAILQEAQRQGVITTGAGGT